MSDQYNPKTGGRGIEWCDATRNATGGCMHDCRWQMPDGTIAVCYSDGTPIKAVLRRQVECARHGWSTVSREFQAG